MMSLLQLILYYSRIASICALSEKLDGYFSKFKAATKSNFTDSTLVNPKRFVLIFFFYCLVKMAGFIKVEAPASCLFSVLCNKLRTDHKNFCM